MLGLAIEAVSGLPYPAAIALWVLEPAGMKFTGFPALDGRFAAILPLSSGVSARIAFSMDSESSIVVLCNYGSVAFRVFRLVLQ